MKGEARCSIKEASLVQGEVSAQRADGGIGGIVNNREQCSSLCLPDTIPQEKIRDFCQPPGGELAVGQERPAWAVTQGGLYATGRSYLRVDAFRKEQRATPVK